MIMINSAEDAGAAKDVSLQRQVEREEHNSCIIRRHGIYYYSGPNKYFRRHEK